MIEARPAAPANPSRNRLIRRIHAEARSRGMADVERRGLQRRATGKDSCADMTVAELRSVVAAMAKAFTRARILERQWRMLRRTGAVRIGGVLALRLYAAHHVGIGRPASLLALTDQQSDALIRHLGEKIRTATVPRHAPGSAPPS